MRNIKKAVSFTVVLMLATMCVFAAAAPVYALDAKPKLQTSEAFSAMALNGKVYLSWKQSADSSRVAYRIYKGIKPGKESFAEYQKLQPVFPIKQTEYVDTDVQNGKWYYYLLAEVDKNGTEWMRTQQEVSVFPDTTANGIVILQIDNPYMNSNGDEKEIDPGKGTAPIILNGRTMVPIRAVIEAMGGSVAWDASERKLSIILKSTKMELFIDRKTANINGAAKEIEVAPQIINGRTMVPLRLVTENLGAKVAWDSTARTITLIYKP